MDPNASDDREEEVVRDWLKRFFGSPDFGLRRIAKAIHHLGLVFASLPSNTRSFAITAAVALIVRTVDSELYYKFVRGEATDLDVVGRVFERNAGLRELQEEHAGCMFETMIVLAAYEVSGDAGDSIDSPLLKRYRERVGDEASDPTARKHAQRVIASLESLTRGTPVDLGTIGRRFGFKHSVQRLELLSPVSSANGPMQLPVSPEESSTRKLGCRRALAIVGLSMGHPLGEMKTSQVY